MLNSSSISPKSSSPTHSKINAKLVAAGFALLALTLAVTPPRAIAAADPSALPATQRLLDYITSSSRQGLVLSMQHVSNPWRIDDLSANPPNEKRSEITRVHDITGRYPAIIGIDFGNNDAFPQRNTSTLSLAKYWSSRGGMVQFQFHEGSPRGYRPEDTSFYSAVLSSSEWNNLLHNNSSSMHVNWQHHMDLLAGWMKQLQDAGVVILWRPYHEGDGTWFWWGGNPTNYRALWQMQFNYLTHTKGLHNLIWVTSAPRSEYYPGDAYVDANGFDFYASNQYDSAFTSTANNLSALHYSEPMALTETGLLPANSVLRQSKYAWVGIWSGGFLDPNYYGLSGGTGNSNAEVQSFYWDAHTICLSDGVWNGAYKIINRNSGQALDASNGGTADNTNVLQWPYSGGANQRWTISYIGNGQYVVGNLKADKALDVANSGGSGANVAIYTNSENNNQRWTFAATSNGYYRITPVHNTSLALDVSGASTANGTNVQVWTWTSGSNQQWSFQTP